MKDKKEFFNILNLIDKREVGEYVKLAGDFDFSRYVLKISQIPGDFEEQNHIFVVRVPQIIAGFPGELIDTPVRRTALEDFLVRRIADQVDQIARFDQHGIARRRLAVARPGQKILPRTALIVTDEYVEARLYLDLPVENGMISGNDLHEIFFEDLPAIVNSSLIFCNLDEELVRESVNMMEDADRIRQMLSTQGLISFVAEGAFLARKNDSDEPDFDHIVQLSVPEEAQIALDVPNAGQIRGLGIPSGITVILGDDFSGRQELMSAIASGIYNHVLGDGRELVITVPDAVQVSAEPGRSVQCVDIESFVRELPDASEISQFSSSHADACLSQAAGAVEALEIGARVLLMDESSSSTSFLGYQPTVCKLVDDGKPNILPVALRARQIVDELGVSLVVGGSSAVAELIPVADTVLRIKNYEVTDITEEAKSMAGPAFEADVAGGNFAEVAEISRWIVPSSIDPSVGKEDYYIESQTAHDLTFGRSCIDLSAVTQLADIHQTETIGLILYYAKLRYMDESRPMREVLDLIDRDLSTEGLECLTPELRGDLARPRRYEIAAALNRLETLRMTRSQQV